MIVDGSSLDTNDPIKCDVCVVGAGAVGYAMAHKLRSTGLDVVVLESGIHNERQGYEWWQRRDWDPLVADLDEGVPNEFVQDARPDFFEASRTRCLGGSTNCWGGFIRPLDAYDFDEWPIQRSDLLKYYKQDLPLLGLGHFDIFDQPEKWNEYTRVKIDPYITEEATKGLLKSVIIQQQQDTSIIDSQDRYPNLFSQEDNLRLIRNANAVRIDYDESRVDALYFRPLVVDGSSKSPGPECRVIAKHYVLAMGGIEIPRFLQLNGVDERLPDIGRYYMNHPKYEACGIGDLVPPAVPDIPRVYGDLIPLNDSPTARIQAFVVPTRNGMTEYGTRNYRIALVTRDDRKTFRVELNFEQAPNPNSRIRLDDKHVDVLGRKLPKLDWRFSEADAATVNGAMRAIYRYFQSRAPVGIRWEEWRFDASRPFPPIFDIGGQKIYTGDHHLGTCRMNSDDEKKDGVVDSNCKVIDFDNLWISSTAVFRTGGWANSTFTLLALALRLADRLQGKIARESP